MDVNGLALSLEVRFLGLGWVSGWGFGLGFLGNSFLECHDKLNAASGRLAFL